MLFPEHIPIKAETMIKMWVAEGFVPLRQRNDEGRETSKNKARQLLQMIIDHTMVQVVKRRMVTKSRLLGLI